MLFTPPGQVFNFINSGTAIGTRLNAGVTTVGKTGSGADVVFAALDVLRENDVLACAIYLSTGTWLTSGTQPQIKASATIVAGSGKSLSTSIMFGHAFYAPAAETVTLPVMGPPLFVQVPSGLFVFNFNFNSTDITGSGGSAPQLIALGYYRTAGA